MAHPHGSPPPHRVRPRFFAALLGMAFILGWGHPVAAQVRLDARHLDSLFDVLAANDRLMGAVTVRQDDRVLYQRAFGYRALGDSAHGDSARGDSARGDATRGPTTAARNDRETAFRIGSITKVFTAVMIYQLVEEGRLTLATPLARFYPRVPQAGAITVAHLLGHTTGLPDYVPGWDTAVPPTRERLLAHVAALRPRFAPGARREYSNTNFLLLGFIVEDLTGTDYGAALERRIVRRVGLRRTHFGGAVRPERNEARAFSFDDGRWTVAPDDDLRLAGGAGGIVSTTDDLTHFAAALFSGRLINAASLHELTTPYADSVGPGGKGMGPFTIAGLHKQGFAHDGSVGAFTALLGYVPEDRVSVAITVNGHNYPQNRVFWAIWDAVYGRPRALPSFTPLQLTDSALARYAGTYADGGALTIAVRAAPGGLVAQTTGQDPFPLTAIGPRTFMNRPAGILIEFTEDSAGTVPRFTLFQRKYAFVLARRPASGAGLPRP